MTLARVDDAYCARALKMGSRDSAAVERYMAALDLEEYVAELYASLVRGAYERFWGEGMSAEASGGPTGGTGRP